jgi:hypothetical protein
MLCAREFDSDGLLRFNPHGHAGAEGSVILVNGAPWPALQVERRQVSPPYSEYLQCHHVHSRP